MVNKNCIENWNQRIAGMSLEELLEIVIDESDCYYAEFVRMARQKLFNDYRMVRRLESNEENLKHTEIQRAEEEEAKRMGTREMLLNVLQEMGCQVEEYDDDEICIFYQGEKFFTTPADEDSYITVYSCWFTMCEVDEIEYMEMVKKAANHSNQCTYVSHFYGMDDETMAVRRSKDVYFTSEIADMPNYLRSVFECFFSAERFFDNEMDRLWKERKD